MDRYEAKRRYVENLMYRNRIDSTLTSEQCDVLEKVCSFRHQLHSNPESLFYSESANYDYFNDMLRDEMSELLSSAGFENSLAYDLIEIPNDHCCYSDEEYEECLCEVHEFVNGVNRDIEQFLRDVDEKYGTHYAPTGFSRLKL